MTLVQKRDCRISVTRKRHLKTESTTHGTKRVCEKGAGAQVTEKCIVPQTLLSERDLAGLSLILDAAHFVDAEAKKKRVSARKQRQTLEM